MLNRPFNAVMTRVVVFSAVLLALVLATSATFAQEEASAMDYAREPALDPVATFTGTLIRRDARMVYWSLTTEAVPDVVETADIVDREHFMINSDGVLSFRFSPDYEMPRGSASDANNTNTYKVVVQASDDPTGAGGAIMMGYKKVTVMVTDDDEPGMVTLSAQKPQVNMALTATLTDDDATPDQITAAKWKWEHSSAAKNDHGL